jgi:hypothetical protein
VTLSRRVAAIETSLSPTQLVLRWLAEAHAYGDVPAYVASLLTQDPPVAPLDRLVREADHGARTARRGKRPEFVKAAVRTALRETVFRFELVMRINVTAHELLDREGLIDAALSANLSLTFGEDERRDDPKRLEHLARLRDLIVFRVSELRAAADARTVVTERYLDGHGALFPVVAAAWEEQVKGTTLIADMANRMTEIDGAPAAAPPDPDLLTRRIVELVADLVEPAKSIALDKLGEGQRAFDIANAWLRPKLAAGPTAIFATAKE